MVSIFMASITAIGCFSSTSSPSAISTLMILPGMFAPISFGSSAVSYTHLLHIAVIIGLAMDKVLFFLQHNVHLFLTHGTAHQVGTSIGCRLYTSSSCDCLISSFISLILDLIMLLLFHFLFSIFTAIFHLNAVPPGYQSPRHSAN